MTKTESNHREGICGILIEERKNQKLQTRRIEREGWREVIKRGIASIGVPKRMCDAIDIYIRTRRRIAKVCRPCLL